MSGNIEVLNQNQNERFTEINRIKELYKVQNPKWRGSNTKDFQKFNMELLKDGTTDTIAFSNNKIYNRNTHRLMNRDTLYTQKDIPRQRFKNDNISLKNDTFLNITQYLGPLETKIMKAEQQTKNVDIPVDFSKFNYNLSKFLNILRPTSKKYLLHNITTGGYWTLSSAVLNSLSDRLKNGNLVQQEFDVDSKNTIVSSFYQGEDWELRVINEENKKSVIDGAFFPFLNKMVNVDLDKYGVHHEVDENNYQQNCLIYSLETAGYDTTAIRCLCKNQEIPMRALKEIATKLDIYITIRRLDDEKKKTHYGNPKKPEIQLGLIEKHYFLIEKIPYTLFSIKNYFELIENEVNDWNKVFSVEINKNTGNKKYKRKNDRWTDSYTAIKYIVENQSQYLTKIKHTEKLYATNKYKQVKEFGSLEYNDKIFDYMDEEPEGNLMVNKPNSLDSESFSKICLDKVFFDFETTTRRKDGKDTIHKPFCLFTDKNTRGYWGRDCGKQFLDELVDRYGVSKGDVINKPRLSKAKGKEGEYICDEDGNPKIDTTNLYEETITFKRYIRLIAHNSSYDFRFLLKYLTKIETIEKGTGLMNANCLYYKDGKVICINIRDSLKMINMPLRKFGSSFGLSVEKEILPYDLYSEENIKKNWIELEECLSWVKENDKEQYIKNCERWNCILDGKVNILKYAGEYCYLDCITLRDGYEKFSGLVKEAINLDINDYMTLPSMANDYLVRQGCYEEVLKLSGVPRHFIQNCVVGGRTMCRRNEKFMSIGNKNKYQKYIQENGPNENVVNHLLADFDAVSLYPSAMSRMKGFLKGKPKIITDFDSIKNTCDGYYVCVEITKVGKKYDFPCCSLLTEDGIRNFTNDLVGEKLYIDKIGLDDLVKFQNVEFKFINGYYYNEGFQTKIIETIKYVFQQRLKYKAMKDEDGNSNPLQLVFKELMNSSYGKTCLKPIDSEDEYIHKDMIEDFVVRNYHYIKEMTLLANGLYYKVKTIKTIDTHFNNVHIGVSILSTSKTIMYEVMCLAEDLNIDMYYTDTDSIHIDNTKIPYLAEKFQEKYGRELIGKNMGQFHTDFDLQGAVGEIVASDSIFLGKKVYIDRITGTDKNGKELEDYHIRMKGVSTNCIIHKGQTEYGGNHLDMYEKLFLGDTLEFNLLSVAPSFELCKNMNIKSRKKFSRRVSFK